MDDGNMIHFLPNSLKANSLKIKLEHRNIVPVKKRMHLKIYRLRKGKVSV